MEKEVFLQEYRAKQRTWYCPICTNITRRRNDSTPVRKYNLHSPPASSADTSTMSSSGGTTAITIDQIEALLDRKFDVFKKAIAQEVQSMVMKEVNCTINRLENGFTETTDFLQRGQDELAKELELANNRIKALETERSGLQSDVAAMDRRLVIIEKTSRSHNLEIHMVPEKRNENVQNIIKKLYETVDVTLEASNISAIRRVAKLDPKSDRPRNILVTLQSERLRDNLLSAVRRYNRANRSNTLNSLHLGIEGERRAVYVAEHLSPATKKLHAETRKFAKDKGFKYVWIKYERVYLRKDDNESAIHIKNTNDLMGMT